MHPEVLENLKPVSEVFKDFLSSFDVPGGKKITYNDFEKYYTNVSACIDSDEVLI